MRGATLCDDNSVLDGAAARRGKLYGASLQGARAAAVDLRGAELVRADLSESDLRFADVQGADFTAVNLRFTKLQGIRLQEAAHFESVIDWHHAEGLDCLTKKAICNKLDPSIAHPECPPPECS
ncbi:MAG: pentapeptide repeat-containing protein [bacterium]|nr:pentapeptide repeat-containing protein [bacterium]